MNEPLLSVKKTWEERWLLSMVKFFAFIFFIFVLLIAPRTLAVAGVCYFKYKDDHESRPDKVIISMALVTAFLADLLIYATLIR